MWRRQPAAPAPAASPPRHPVVREDYRTNRLALLRSVVDPETSDGLEIGAFDLPVVQPGEPAGSGRCWFADVRSSQQLSQTFAVPLENVAPIEWVVRRDRPLVEQIPRRFDYVILCHVIEHVPDPIRFLPDVAALLRPGGVLFLAVPDKRETLDAPRPSTTVDHLLARHYHGAPGPPLAQIMEFARAWDDNWRRLASESPQEFLSWGVAQYESGTADVHCNVWRDDELFAQLDYLTRGGFLPGLEICLREPQANGLNEFYVALRKTPHAPA